MTFSKAIDGFIEWHVPGVEGTCKTWYRVYGDLKSGLPPVLALHGGPGFSCDYMMCMQDLTILYSLPVIIYDQIGIGRSSHVPEKKGDGSFWTCELFLEELDAVIKHFGIEDSYSIVGQSWGGMLAAMHAIRQPKGLKKLVLADSLSDMPLFSKGVERLRTALPQEVQDEMKEHEVAGTTDSERYEKCVDVYFAKHVIRIDPMPGEFIASGVAYKENKNVYSTM
jgi:proline-specific peptidase